METSTIHQADGGREEEWAESQQWAEYMSITFVKSNLKQSFLLCVCVCVVLDGELDAREIMKWTLRGKWKN